MFTKSLILMVNSKTQLVNTLGVDPKDLNKKYLDKGKLYYLRFLFTTTPIPEMSVESVMTIEDAQLLFKQTRADTPRSVLQGNKNKGVLAEHTVNSALTQTFPSLEECARVLKGDRQTIRTHLNSHSSSLYRKVWKLS